MENKMMCSVCGVEKDRYDMIKFNDNWYCYDCMEERYFFCEEHHNYEPIELKEVIMTCSGDTVTLCKKAKNIMYKRCPECGDYIRYDEGYELGDEVFCYDCYCNKKVIKSYHSSHEHPREFFGNPLDGIYFGLEIESEVDYCDYSATRDERAYNVKTKIENCFKKDFLFFEEDGSLDEGFETISQPMSYEFIKNNNVVELITDFLKEQGMYASCDCGLHIHITKTDKVKSKMPKILNFFENNKEDLIKFSRRDNSSFREWCDFYSNYDEKLTALEAERICLRPGDRRHMCINLTNRDTIEFRCFAGTLNSRIVYGCIEFILTLLENIDDIENFEDLKRINKFDNLKYLLI